MNLEKYFKKKVIIESADGTEHTGEVIDIESKENSISGENEITVREAQGLVSMPESEIKSITTQD